MEKNEQVGNTSTEQVSRAMNAIGMNMPKQRRNELYFGQTPRGTYPAVKDLAHMHDMTMSGETKRRLYGLGKRASEGLGDVIESRLGTDSRSGLVSELVNETQLTRKEAEALVSRWMATNDLVEVEDPTLGKILVPREGR